MPILREIDPGFSTVTPIANSGTGQLGPVWYRARDISLAQADIDAATHTWNMGTVPSSNPGSLFMLVDAMIIVNYTNPNSDLIDFSMGTDATNDNILRDTQITPTATLNTFQIWGFYARAYHPIPIADGLLFDGTTDNIKRPAFSSPAGITSQSPSALSESIGTFTDSVVRIRGTNLVPAQATAGRLRAYLYGFEVQVGDIETVAHE